MELGELCLHTSLVFHPGLGRTQSGSQGAVICSFLSHKLWFGYRHFRAVLWESDAVTVDLKTSLGPRWETLGFSPFWMAESWSLPTGRRESEPLLEVKVIASFIVCFLEGVSLTRKGSTCSATGIECLFFPCYRIPSAPHTHKLQLVSLIDFYP